MAINTNNHLEEEATNTPDPLTLESEPPWNRAQKLVRVFLATPFPLLLRKPSNSSKRHLALPFCWEHSAGECNRR